MGFKNNRTHRFSFSKIANGFVVLLFILSSGYLVCNLFLSGASAATSIKYKVPLAPCSSPSSSPCVLPTGQVLGSSTGVYQDITGDVHVSGNMGVGTGAVPPASTVQVQGSGGPNINFKVNGRMQTGDSNGQGGMWVDGTTNNLFVGQTGTSVGFYARPAGWVFTTNANGVGGAGQICLNGLAPANCISSWSQAGATGANYWTATGNDISNNNSGNVGIATATPKNKLDVKGGMAVGSYAGANVAPSNGMIISGNVGIGTNTTVFGGGNYVLNVGGPVAFNNTVVVGSGNGTIIFPDASGSLNQGMQTLVGPGDSRGTVYPPFDSTNYMSINTATGLVINSYNPNANCFPGGCGGGASQLLGIGPDAKWQTVIRIPNLIKLADGGLHEVDITNCEGSLSDQWIRLVTSGVTTGLNANGVDHTGVKWTTGGLCGNNTSYAALAVGNFFAAGSIRFSDVAEMMNVNPDANVQSGDILTSKRDVNANEDVIEQSRNAYDSSVMGIVSSPETATIVLGTKGQNPGEEWTQKDKKPVALAGRVLVKVSDINGKIQKGDPITTSNIMGFGMKATRAGAIVGKALADFDPEHNTTNKKLSCPSTVPSGTTCGQVLIYVNISWFDGGVDITQLSQTVASQQAEIDLLKKEIDELRNK